MAGRTMISCSFYISEIHMLSATILDLKTLIAANPTIFAAVVGALLASLIGGAVTIRGWSVIASFAVQKDLAESQRARDRTRIDEFIEAVAEEAFIQMVMDGDVQAMTSVFSRLSGLEKRFLNRKIGKACTKMADALEVVMLTAELKETISLSRLFGIKIIVYPSPPATRSERRMRNYRKRLVARRNAQKRDAIEQYSRFVYLGEQFA
jgi:hypothetical protein